MTLHLTQFVVRAEYDTFYLPPTGHLCDVLVETNLAGPWYKNDVRCEITDCDQIGLFADFTIPSGSGYHCGGVRFKEPVPNVNSATPYVLRFLDEHPDVRVSLVSESIW